MAVTNVRVSNILKIALAPLNRSTYPLRMLANYLALSVPLEDYQAIKKLNDVP